MGYIGRRGLVMGKALELTGLKFNKLTGVGKTEKRT